MEFPDWRVDEYAVNIIIDNTIAQIDDQLWDNRILEEIVDLCCDLDVDIFTGEQSYTNVNGVQLLVITTNVWDVQVKCRDQITDWVPLHIIKESGTI